MAEGVPLAGMALTSDVNFLPLARTVLRSLMTVEALSTRLTKSLTSLTGVGVARTARGRARREKAEKRMMAVLYVGSVGGGRGIERLDGDCS